jgi:hypothetical protein
MVNEMLLIAEIRGNHTETHCTRDVTARTKQSAHNSSATNILDKFQRLLQVYQRCISGNYVPDSKTRIFNTPDNKSRHLTWK